MPVEEIASGLDASELMIKRGGTRCAFTRREGYFYVNRQMPTRAGICCLTKKNWRAA